MPGPIPYRRPARWIQLDPNRVFQPLADAKAAVYALTTTPFQRAWVEQLQEVQLKMEVAGTSRIEGAEFTDRELDIAIRSPQTSEELLTRSQRQAKAAVQTYRWIEDLNLERPVDEPLIREVHRHIVTGCDDDHCEPGALRGRDDNVTFGMPPHRGCEGGPECDESFAALVEALGREFRDYDPLIQALAVHYHLAAMHPFQDGNGRTARAVEALLLQRAGLRDAAFIAMSNYYYENRPMYLQTLAAVRAGDGDLTPFLEFGLTGIAMQCRRLFGEIRRQMQKALFRNTMYELFNRLQSTRKRVMGKRQLRILDTLLEADELPFEALWPRIRTAYAELKSPAKVYNRDLLALTALGAVVVHKEARASRIDRWLIAPNLEWPAQITESEFFRRISSLPRGKMFAFMKSSQG